MTVESPILIMRMEELSLWARHSAQFYSTEGFFVPGIGLNVRVAVWIGPIR